MKITLIGDGKLGKHLYKVFISIDQIQLLEWVVRSKRVQDSGRNFNDK